MGFGPRPEVAAQQEADGKAAHAAAEKQRIKGEKREAKRAVKKARRKTGPELLEFSRELRDRWQDAVAADPGLLLERQAGKYDVGRLIENYSTSSGVKPLRIVDVQRAETGPTIPEARRLDAA